MLIGPWEEPRGRAGLAISGKENPALQSRRDGQGKRHRALRLPEASVTLSRKSGQVNYAAMA